MGAETNLVHESEAQRQYARVKIPAKILYRSREGQYREALVHDLSAGGFSFEVVSGDKVAKADYFSGHLMFDIEGIGLKIAVDFQVKDLLPQERVCCEFQNMGAREISALRSLISAYVTGELITVGEVINILQRDNFTKGRGAKRDQGQSSAEKMRAFALSAVAFLAGLAALYYVGNKVYEVYGVTKSKSAEISMPGQAVTMPREGTIQSLVKVGSQVKRGEPLATFTSNVVSAVQGGGQPLSTQGMQAMFGSDLQGSITSPCDCQVVNILASDGQAVAKGAEVFELAAPNSPAYVDAIFSFMDADRLNMGTSVTFKVVGDENKYSGVITGITVPEGQMTSRIRVRILPDSALPGALSARPVQVTLDNTIFSSLTKK